MALSAIIGFSGLVAYAGAGIVIKNRSIDLNSGLIGHWPLDGDVNDISGNNYHGTVSGAVPTQDRFGNSDSAYSFDGLNDYIQLPAITNIRSVSFWINKAAGQDAAWNYILDARDGLPSGYMASQGTGGQWNVQYVNGAPATVGWSSIPDDEWTHVYIQASIPFTDDLNIMSRVSNNETTEGLIDEYRLYSRPLSAAEVQALYESQEQSSRITIADTQKGLIGHWKFDGDTKDSTPYGNHGTVIGSPVPADDRHSQSEKAYTFNGTDSGISLGNLNEYFTTEGTISFWVKETSAVTGTPSRTGIISFGTSPHNSHYPWTNGLAYFDVFKTVRVNDISLSEQIDRTQWHLVTITSKPGVNGWKLYQNTELVYQTTGDASVSLPANALLGKSTTSYYLDGQMDDVRIYNRAISIDEITRLYDSYSPGLAVSDLSKGLVGHWDFNGDAKDKTPYSSHASVVGAALASDRFGQPDSAYALSSNNYLDLKNPNHLNFGNDGSYSIQWWINKQGSFKNYDSILSKGVVGNQRVHFLIDNSGYIFRWDAFHAGQTIPLDNWVHVVYTYAASASNYGTEKFYINGQETNSRTGAMPGWHAPDNFRVGYHIYSGGSWPFQGRIDDVRIYNRALSSADVQRLYSTH